MIPIQGSATFSPCCRYRYSLLRWWSVAASPKTINFICLNPSTATAEISDPTVTRLIVRAQNLGFERLVVTNIFAFRSTDPKGLLKMCDPNGPDNNAALISVATDADMVVCAWSSDRAAKHRGPAVAKMLRAAGIKLHALKLSERTGQPCHPLYLKYALTPFEWS